ASGSSGRGWPRGRAGRARRTRPRPLGGPRPQAPAPAPDPRPYAATLLQGPAGRQWPQPRAGDEFGARPRFYPVRAIAAGTAEEGGTRWQTDRINRRSTPRRLIPGSSGWSLSWAHGRPRGTRGTACWVPASRSPALRRSAGSTEATSWSRSTRRP